MRKILDTGVLRVVFGVALIVALLAGSAFAYDKRVPDPMPLKTDWEASFSYPLVTALGSALGLTLPAGRGTFEIKEGFWMQRGSGVVVAPGLVLTNWHVVNAQMIELGEDRNSSRVTDPLAQTSRTVYITDYKDVPILCTVFYENPEVDIAVLKFNAKDYPWLKPIKYLVEYDPNGIESGDAVVAVLHDRSDDPCDEGQMLSSVGIRIGEIMSPEPMGPSNTGVASVSPFDITLTLVIQNGDSGSPLFVFRNGIPILIGLTRADIRTHMWYSSYAAQLPIAWRLISAARGESLYNRYEPCGLRRPPIPEIR